MGRLLNLVKGFFSLFVAKVETEHPEIVYQNSIDAITVKAVQLRDAAAAIIRRRDELEDRYETKTRELKDVEGQLQVAVTNGDEEVGEGRGGNNAEVAIADRNSDCIRQVRRKLVEKEDERLATK